MDLEPPSLDSKTLFVGGVNQDSTRFDFTFNFVVMFCHFALFYFVSILSVLLLHNVEVHNK